MIIPTIKDNTTIQQEKYM